MPYTDFLGEMIAGSTLPIRFTITSSDGEVMDITSWTDGRLTGKTSLAHTDAQALFQKTQGGSGFTITAAASGIVDVRILPADTLSIVKTTRVYVELQFDAGTDTWNPATGYIIVHPSATLNA